MKAIADAMHGLCAALHAERIDPADMVVELPREQWWKLHCMLAAVYGHNSYDGRGALPGIFRWMGVAYRAKD